MTKFLIEVPHSSNKLECLRAAEVFLRSGSHFLANADWGCLDGKHKAWFVLEADSKEQALMVVPPVYRKETIVTQLNKFKIKEIEDMLKMHNA
jgi:hypothetical protein